MVVGEAWWMSSIHSRIGRCLPTRSSTRRLISQRSSGRSSAKRLPLGPTPPPGDAGRIHSEVAATQVFSHLSKIVVYGAPLLAASGKGMPPLWVFLLAVPLSMAGTVAGGQILDRMTDVNFKRWTRWIVTGVGVGYLVQAAQLFLHGG